MAQREREKTKRALRTSATPVSETEGPARLEQRLKAVERERDALKAELDAVQLKLAALDQSRRQVADRIEWIIDSLHALIDKDA